MDESKGYISIIVLLVMVVIVMFAVYLLNILEHDYLTVNATKNSIQAFYSAESKLYLLLNKDEYYYDQLFPIIKRYIKYGRIGSDLDPRIILNKEDLIDDDNKNIISLNFLYENSRRILELTIDSNVKGINKRLIAELYIINEIYEMGLPIVAVNSVTQDKRDEFLRYMEYLQKEIEITELEDGIDSIYIWDCDEVEIFKDESVLKIKCYRSDLINPVKEEKLLSNKIFLIVKNRNDINNTDVNIMTNFDKMSMEGIVYTEGDLHIYGDFELKGVLIVNGKLVIYPEANVNINGIVLSKFVEVLNNQNNLLVTYDFFEIKKYGIYLPGFIDMKVNKIKSN